MSKRELVAVIAIQNQYDTPKFSKLSFFILLLIVALLLLLGLPYVDLDHDSQDVVRQTSYMFIIFGSWLFVRSVPLFYQFVGLKDLQFYAMKNPSKEKVRFIEEFINEILTKRLRPIEVNKTLTNLLKKLVGSD